MKEVKTLSISLFTFAMAFVMVSCSNNDNTEEESKRVNNTSWSSGDMASHSSALVAIDKTEANTAIEAKMNQAVGLQYSKETKSEDGYWFWDLCEQNGHDCDSVLTASFDNSKCSFHIKVTKSKAKASQTKIENFYRFSEGSYIVRFGSNRYEEITVYSYGVYRADGTLFIPLDGKGCVTYQTKYIYSNKEIFNEDIEDYDILADYKISNNVITFSYIKDNKRIEFTGTISADKNKILIDNNPIVHSIRALNAK